MNAQPDRSHADRPSLGPLDALLDDDSVLEIMVNRYDKVFVERRSHLEEVPDVFRDEDDLLAVVETARTVAEAMGRRLDARNPVVDVRLSDDARMNIVLPPIAAFGPALTIRKFSQYQLTAEQLISYNSWDEQIMQFLQACTRGRLNMIIAGGTGSGKTTVLNIITGMIPVHERVITVENALELQPPPTLNHLVRLESRPRDHEGYGEVTIQDLIVNALRMRPDRLVLGEARSKETLEILQAINTGHDGTLFSIHATSPRDVLTRLEMMCSMHEIAFPLLTIRHMIASAIDVITYQERLQDGKRKMMKVAEVVGMQGDVIELQDIFEFRNTGLDAEGHITGYFSPTGYIPTFMDRLQWAGVTLPDDFFTPR